MDPVYFSHGYRKREAPFAGHFTRLMRANGFLPSLDPPSADVNSAKLERHLGYTIGEISVVSDRSGSVSPYIMYEISMCIRAKKPLLVFVEDTVKDGLLPQGILQSRFSGKSFVRQTPEHAHSINMFRNFIGEKPRPKYGQTNNQKSCILIGFNSIGDSYKRGVFRELRKRGYKIIDSTSFDEFLVQTGESHFRIASASLAICFVDKLELKDSYILGVVQDSIVPTILLTKNKFSPLRSSIPLEYQRRHIHSSIIKDGMKIIRSQIDLFEEDFLDLDDSTDTRKYAEELIKTASSGGVYTSSTRERFIQEITMGDKNIVNGQVGAVGSNSHVHDVQFNQLWDQSKTKIDLGELALELESLRNQISSKAKSAEEHVSVGAIASAELEAKNGNGPKAMSWLAKSGKWAFDNATKIGVSVAAAALKVSLGL